MDLSKLNKRITFQCLAGNGENEAGETTLKNTALKSVWASIDPVSGREYEEAKKLRPELTYKITVRYSKFLDDNLTTNMTIAYKNRTFDIVDIINPKESNEKFEIIATEKVDNRGCSSTN